MAEDNHKTYIWIRPSSLQAHSQHGSPPTSNKKRGAPGEEETWGWTPGYYSKSASDQSKHTYTLLSLQDGQSQEYTIQESQTSSLLECGDLVLANEWEGNDFTSGLNYLNNTEEEEYNYDESSDDDDDSSVDNRQQGLPPSILDRPVDIPPDNLIELTHLHEPSVVHALRHRYKSCVDDMSGIYTDTGPILLAVNPFKADETGRLYGGVAVGRYRARGEKEWLEKREGENGSGGSSRGGKDVLMNQREEEEVLGPHVYAVADRTFRTLMSRLHPLDGSASSSSSAKKATPGGIGSTSSQDSIINQSVLVSGESGAGKTVTTKLLMGYLAKLSQNPTNQQIESNTKQRLSQLSKEMSIERRVLESNPIMESFGNARTVRNDNSSRFGKYIEMKFTAKGGSDKSQHASLLGATLIGASIETYLLEKVRLVHQSPGERNYHIFYEIFSLKYDDDFDQDEFVGTVIDQSAEGSDQANLSREELVNLFGLGQYDLDDFTLVNSSGTFDRRDGVSDSSTFADLCRAMSIMGFKRGEQIDVFAVIAALLHASNLTFNKIGEVECELEHSSHLDYVLDLLGITKEGLNHALCYYEIVVRGETHKKVLSAEQASKGVEALIKATYGTMFSYLVGRINASVSGSDGAGAATRTRRNGAFEASIGILDIFGFESFQSNSFEQLCINYCNEALQQQFNRFVLRNEQEEYDREGIPWSYIEFPENQDVLDLIDLKGTGIINILHDQCRTPGASDKSFSMLMYEKCTPHSRFEADPRMVAEKLFAIHHYAGLVEYSVEGFMEKNKDELPKSSAELLLSSSNKFVKIIANEMVQPSSAITPAKKQLSSPRGSSSQRPTVGIQFSAQLHDLRKKIDDTSPHYIRCLKPNNQLVPDLFDAALIADQLRCAGVIEAVRVSRLGYPQRYSHSSFISRYRVLGMKALSKKKLADRKYNPAKALVHTISKQIIKNNERDASDDIGIQVGKTKIFLRRNSYDLLEKLRTEKISSSAVQIQSFGRRILYMKRFQRYLASVISIQCFIRRIQAKSVVMKMRRQHNSLILQKYWRMHRATRILQSAKLIGIWAQTQYRGNLDRAIYKQMNRDRRALQIQTQLRRYAALNKFRRTISAVIVIQCSRRSYTSRVLLSLKKAEARDLGAVVQERDRLRNEVSALKTRLQQANEAPPQSQDFSGATLEKINEKDTEIEYLRVELQRMKAEKESKENELAGTMQELTNIKAAQDDALSKIGELEQLNAGLQELIMSSQCSDEELERLKKENGQLLSEFTELKSLHESMAQEGTAPKQSSATYAGQSDHSNVPSTPVSSHHSNVPPTPVTAEIECALEKALARIAELEEANATLGKLQSTKTIAAADADQKPIATGAIDFPSLPVTSVYTTATTDNMTADTDDEVAKLREENQVLRTQLELLRDNQGVLPDILGSDQEYEESVNPSDSDGCSEEGDESSGFASANIPDKVMKRICSEVEEATEEVIRQTRAESEARIAELESKIAELQEDVKDAKRSAKYDLDDMARANRSLRRELEEANEEMSRMYSELEAKTDEFDALNEDVERFAETFAAQHEEVRQLERQVRRLQEENTNLKLLDDANRKRIVELQNESKGKADSVSTPDDQGRMMWRELAKMRKEIANMQQNKLMSPSGSVQNANNQTRRGSCSDLSSDDEDEECEDEL